MNENIKSAIEKLVYEAQYVSGQMLPAIGIYHYLRKLIEEGTNETLIHGVLEKKFSNCLNFIMEQYRDIALDMMQGIGSFDRPECVSVGASAEEFYEYAIEYYTLPDEVLKQRAEEKAAIRKAKVEAARKKREEERQAEREAEKKKQKEKDKAEKEKKKAEEKAKKIAEEGQISLI